MRRVKKKGKRTYDASGRLERAQRNHDLILDVAHKAFLDRGYAATTLSAIAREARVSIETIHKTFGGKTGLVRALYQRGLGGSGNMPAPERSDAIFAKESGRVIFERCGAFVAEISPVVSPIHLLLRTAAAADPDLQKLLRESDEQRTARMRHNARVMVQRRLLRKDVTVERAADIMWMCTSPELYELFIVKRGWTPRQLGSWVTMLLTSALL